MKGFFTTVLILFCISNLNAFSDSLENYQHSLSKKFLDTKLPKLEDFSKSYLSELSNSRAIFYPFGGPDVLYPITLFPNSETFTIVGLEKTNSGLECLSQVEHRELDKQLGSLLKRSFFVTVDMSHAISGKCGILPILMTQINMLGGKIIKIKNSDLDFGSMIKIQFNHMGKEKKVIYFKSNLMNSNLKDSFLDYIKLHHLVDISMIKASSFSMHNKEFSNIRDFIIKESNIILQDDTGIPIRYLKGFHLKLFGSYIHPYGKEWVNYKQTDLVELYKIAHQSYNINFCYGYGCGKITPAIILAIKKLD